MAFSQREQESDAPCPATHTHRQRFQASFSYPVIFSEDIFASENDALVNAIREQEPSRRHRLLFVLDEGLLNAQPELLQKIEAYGTHHREHMELAGSPQVVPGGEALKNDPVSVEKLLHTFAAARLDRQAFVVAVGGGAVIDCVGYAAAIWHRGVRHVRIPTTVLSQADAGLGVKNGVNFAGVKNGVGTFAAPWAVLNDATLLTTLGDRERTEGMAEAVKVALIKDAAFFSWLETHREALRRFEPQPVRHLIRRAAELHLDHIAHGGDPFERGMGRPLDFGHWAAHKLEVFSHGQIHHGEAVSLGMAIDILYSVQKGLLDEHSGHRALRLLTCLGLPTWHAECGRHNAAGQLRLLEGLDDFQEHLGGELTLALLNGIGTSVDETRIDRDAMTRSIEQLEKRQTKAGA